MKNNISLIGFMGSGKTTSGRILADKLKYLFFDLDKLIEISEQSEINDIFKKSGEDYFRGVEAKVVRKVLYNKNCVFACGGGVVLRGENMKIISKNSIIVYLMISPLEAIKRLSKAKNRPLLSDQNRDEIIYELINKRDKLYSKYADIIIKNENINPGKTVEKVISIVQKKGLLI